MPGCTKIDPTEKPHECLRKGIFVGKNMSVKITNALSKDILREIASKSKIPNYSRKTKKELLDALYVKGIKQFKPFDLME